MKPCPTSRDLLYDKPCYFLCFVNLIWILRDSNGKYVKAFYTRWTLSNFSIEIKRKKSFILLRNLVGNKLLGILQCFDHFNSVHESYICIRSNTYCILLWCTLSYKYANRLSNEDLRIFTLNDVVFSKP